MMDDAVIKVRNLTAGYGDIIILQDINLDILRGRVTSIIGGSGCGKTTLLKCIVGLLKPVSGTVEVLSKNVHDLTDAELKSLLKKTGLLFQGGAMINSLTVAENVAVPLKEHTDLPEPIIRDLIRLKLDLVGLSHAYNLYPSELSGGMRKRAALARAMALDPSILLCDEPSAGLDPVTAAGLDGLILKLRELFNITVVAVTHEVTSIKTISDNVVMLGRGHLIFNGTIKDALQSDNRDLVDFFYRSPQKTEQNSMTFTEFFNKEFA
jgi:phospholipid/cholesterol/gamma-HCH transport system ATP-binding protein